MNIVFLDSTAIPKHIPIPRPSFPHNWVEYEYTSAEQTIERAKDNLNEYSNISFICGDFNGHEFDETFDVIYSSLTMMHFENKEAVINKVDKLLNDNGIFCLSIDKNQSEYIDMGTRKIKVYPDTLDNITLIIEETAMSVVNVIETDNAYIIVSRKQ